MNDRLGCIDPHGYYPFPASREVCPKCIAIRARMFTPRHGLKYRWWKEFNWPLVVGLLGSLMIWAFAILILGAWVFDWKPLW
jgi:hypothetical protein